MFQFRRFPTYAYLIQHTLLEYCSSGFPHSEIHGSKPICGSPWLIAACHVLHRLSVPRHSPCALYSLTYVHNCIYITRIRKISVKIIFSYFCSRLISQSYPNNKRQNLDLIFFTIRITIVWLSSIVAFAFVILFSFQGAIIGIKTLRVSLHRIAYTRFARLSDFGGLERTRTSDLTLIRRTL